MTKVLGIQIDPMQNHLLQIHKITGLLLILLLLKKLVLLKVKVMESLIHPEK